MALKKTLDVDVNIEGGKSLKDLKNEFKEIQNELSSVAIGTDEYRNKLKQLANVKDDIDDLNEAIGAQTGAGKFQAFANLGSSIASGFAAAQGAMSLFGSESKEVEQALLKVQSAMALAEGLKGLEGIGDAFNNVKTIVKDLWKVIIANPLLAVAAAVAALGIATLAIIEKMSKQKTEAELLKESYEKLKISTEAQNESYDIQILALQGLKTNEEAILEIQAKKLQANINLAKAGAEAAKKAREESEQKVKDNEKELSLIGKLFSLSALGNIADIAKQNQIEKTTELKNEEEKATLALQKAEAELAGFTNVQTQKKLDKDQAAADKAKELRKKELEEKKKHADELAALDAELAELEKSEEERKRKEKEEQKAKEEKDILAAMERDKAINQQFLEEKLAQEELANQKRLEAKKRLQDALNSIENSAFSIASSLAILSTNNQKKQQEIEKKIAVAKLAIDTAKAISGAVAQAQSIPFPGNIAAIAAGVATVLANIAQAKQLLSSAGAETGSIGGGGGGGGGGSLNQTFSSPIIGQGISNTSTQLTETGEIKTPVKAYVVQTDIANENHLVTQIEKKAKIE